MSDTEQFILNTTEDMIRQGGYNGFSFRNIADAIGIKSSSVHYHFETKEKLGAATAKRYTENFLIFLGEPEQLKDQGINPVVHYVAAFRGAITSDNGMCLCGILGTEANMLPESIVTELNNFFDKNVQWLERAYEQIGVSGAKDLHKKAVQTLSLLEGAMMIAISKKDISFFDTSAQIIVDAAEKLD